MDILTAILACSLHADDNLVRAIVQSTSLSNSYSVVDTVDDPEASEPPPPAPRTLDEAEARVAQIAARGGTPLLGLMQVPIVWAERFGRHPRDLFDPCINISIGTAMLSQFEHQCAVELRPKAARPRKLAHPKPRPTVVDRRPCILREYARAIGIAEFAVVAALELDHQKSTSLVAKASETPIFCVAEPERSWGTDRIFFQTSTAEVGVERLSADRVGVSTKE